MIDVKDVFHLYEGKDTSVPALRGLNLQVESGEILIVRGPNGSGKSTLIEILAGAIKPSSGQVTVSGSLRLLRQQGNVLPELTVAEYLGIATKDVDELLSTWGLIDLKIKKMKDLNPGATHLISAISVLASNPDVLLADEPAATLSIEESKVLYSRITDHCRNNKTALVMVTHDKTAEEFADRIVRISDGRISEQWQSDGVEHSVIDKNGWLKLPRSVKVYLPTEALVETDLNQVTLQGLNFEPSLHKASQRQKDKDFTRVSCQKVSIDFISTETGPLLSFDVFDGSLTAIHGFAGSGKTTLLQAIASQRALNAGEIEVHGSLSLFSNNVENLLSVREAGVSEELIQLLGLMEYADRPMNRLSGGQRQKSLIGLALCSASEILLIDDPVNALDEDNSDLIMRLLAEQTERTIIYTTSEFMNTEYADQVISISTD